MWYENINGIDIIFRVSKRKNVPKKDKSDIVNGKAFFIEFPLSKKELKLLSVSWLQLCVDLSKFSLVFYKTFKDFSKCGDYSRRKLIRYFQYNFIIIIFNITTFTKNREKLGSESVQLKIK